MDYKTREEFKAGMTEWFENEGFYPDHYMTLTFRDNKIGSINHERAVKALKKFIITLNAELFGRRSKKALKMATYIEGSKHSRRHFHILLEAPSDAKNSSIELFKKRITDIWIRSDSLAGNPLTHDETNKKWFKEIESKNHRENCIHYSLKEHGIQNEPFQVELSNFSGRKIKHR